MTNEELMQIMTDLGLHEGGMENWVKDNAWLRVANEVQAREREACILDIKWYVPRAGRHMTEYQMAEKMIARIRARGQA